MYAKVATSDGLKIGEHIVNLHFATIIEKYKLITKMKIRIK